MSSQTILYFLRADTDPYIVVSLYSIQSVASGLLCVISQNICSDVLVWMEEGVFSK